MGVLDDIQVYTNIPHYCRRCGRILTSEKSVKEGIGSHCKTLERLENERASERRNLDLFGEHNG